MMIAHNRKILCLLYPKYSHTFPLLFKVKLKSPTVKLKIYHRAKYRNSSSNAIPVHFSVNNLMPAFFSRRSIFPPRGVLQKQTTGCGRLNRIIAPPVSPVFRSLRTLQELPFLPVKMHRKNEAVKTSFPRLLLLLRKPVMCVPAFSLLYNLSIFNHLLQ